MANNRRILYAVQQISIKGDGVASYTALHGVQNFNKTTTFNLEQAYELGQLAIYENIEGIPTVEASVSKVLDGYPLIWHEATIQATEPTLINRANQKCLIACSIFPDTNTSASGTPGSEVEISGAQVSALSYQFGVDGFFTESLTFQANNIVWANDSRMLQSTPWAGATTLGVTGAFSSNDDAPIGSGGVNKRENLIWAYSPSFGLDLNDQVADPDTTILPPEIEGISASGTNEISADAYTASVQSINVNCNLSREEILQLGRLTPYFRAVQFPTEVTCEVVLVSSSGDMIGATEGGILTPNSSGRCAGIGNLTDSSIRIATCEGTRIYLGHKNKLASVQQSGGDAGGGNVQTTYQFTTFNELTVIHSGDPNSNGATWWTNRADWLVN